jgi:hypothetical protein
MDNFTLRRTDAARFLAQTQMGSLAAPVSGSRLRCRLLWRPCRRGAGAAMIPVPSGVRVWLAVGRTDMRKGMNGLALQVQQALGHDPHAGDLYVFRGARGDLLTNTPASAFACRGRFPISNFCRSATTSSDNGRRPKTRCYPCAPLAWPCGSALVWVHRRQPSTGR